MPLPIIHFQGDFNPYFAPGEATDEIWFEKEFEGIAEISLYGDPPAETKILVAGRPNEAAEQLKNLEAVLVPYAGVPPATIEFVRARPGVALYNLHFNADTTAEMAVGLLISAGRGIVEADKQMRKGMWRGRMDDSDRYLLHTKTVTILGYGSVGRRVGLVLSALGMQVIGIRRTFDPSEPEVLGLNQLEDALERSHVLVITAPGTNEAVGLITRKEIEMLTEPRIVVNVGRGAIISEADFYHCLKDGTIAAAGSDVWYQYPQLGSEPPQWPSGLPFHELENLVMSPHRGGNGDDTEVLRTRSLVEMLKAILAGDAPKAVDLDAGY